MLKQVTTQNKMSKTLITESMRVRVLQAARYKGINKSQLADALGVKPAWITKFLNGTLKSLSDEIYHRIEDFFSINLVTISQNESHNPAVSQLSEMADNDSEVANMLMALTTCLNRKKFSLPYIPPDLLTELGQVANQASHRDPDKDGKIGRIIVAKIQEIYDLLHLESSSWR